MPGSPGDYKAELAGTNNGSTAIYYVADPDIDFTLGLGVAGTGFSTDYAIDLELPAEVVDPPVLVAYLENTVARNMFNSDFYDYI